MLFDEGIDLTASSGVPPVSDSTGVHIARGKDSVTPNPVLTEQEERSADSTTGSPVEL